MSRTKLKKFEKLQLMTNVIQPSRDDLLNDSFCLKGGWSTQFGNNNPIVLELGCGKGEYTVGLAKIYPECNYIGLDIKGSRIYSGAKQAFDENLKNVIFVRTQVEYLEAIFAKDEISEIWLTFPDPQIKFNRRKKRLTHPSKLKKYKTILNQKGIINLKTDSIFLHGYTLGILELGPYKIIKSMHDIYNTFYNDQRLDIKTHYEKMFLHKNLPISYLSFSFL